MATNTTPPTNGDRYPRPLREKVEFPLNIPVLLTLDFDDGQLTAGRFGDQYQYTFDQGTRIAWLDPEVRELILKTGAAARDEIAICRREIKGANGRKRAQWEVKKVEEDNDGPTQAEIDAAERADAEARATRNREEAERLARAAQPAKASRAKKAEAPPAPPANDQRTALTCKLARDFADCLFAAVTACQLSTAESEKLGFPLPWTASDVRTIATTMYIGASRGERS